MSRGVVSEQQYGSVIIHYCTSACYLCSQVHVVIVNDTFTRRVRACIDLLMLINSIYPRANLVTKVTTAAP